MSLTYECLGKFDKVLIEGRWAEVTATGWASPLYQGFKKRETAILPTTIGKFQVELEAEAITIPWDCGYCAVDSGDDPLAETFECKHGTRYIRYGRK